MNKKEFRRRKIEIDNKLVDIRRKEHNAFERKLEYDIAVKSKKHLMDAVEATIKLVKLEIKEILEGKTTKSTLPTKSTQPSIEEFEKFWNENKWVADESNTKGGVEVISKAIYDRFIKQYIKIIFFN